MQKTPCAFCGAESRYEPFFNGPGVVFHTSWYGCPKCGTYALGEMLGLTWQEHKGDDAFKIACLAREKQLVNERAIYGVFEDSFVPTADNIAKYVGRWWRIGELLADFPKPGELVDRALLNLARLTKYPMDHIEIPNAEIGFFVFCPESQAGDLISYMRTMGLLGKGDDTMESYDLQVTPTGWARVDRLRAAKSDSRQTFVAMWFEPKMDDAYIAGIKPAVEAAGFACKRIDAVEHNNKICDEIVAEIRKSRFVVADFTGQRGGVYFEAGFGMGLGIPVIWLVHKDDVDKLHFDTRQYNHIVYESVEDLKQRLYNRIAATIH